jgi:hypothetical protein
MTLSAKESPHLSLKLNSERLLEISFRSLSFAVPQGLNASRFSLGMGFALCGQGCL